MATETKQEKKVIGKVGNFLSKISIGIVFVMILGWLYLRPDTIFPNNAAYWKEYIQTSIIFLFLVFGFGAIPGKTLIPIFNISFFKEIWKFGIAAVITGGFLYGIQYIVHPGSLPTIWAGLAGIPIWALLLYAFVVSYPEELGFRGKLYYEFIARNMKNGWAIVITTLIFAVFHAAIGRSWITLLIYIPLGLIFSYVRDRFTPVSQMANAGVHFAWDVFLFGFLGIR